MLFAKRVTAVAARLLLLGVVVWGGQQMAVLPIGVRGNVAVVDSILFDADACASIDGWSWVRPDCRQYVDWVFAGVDATAVSSEDPYIYVNFGALVTNGVNGGSGWDTQVGMEVWIVATLDDIIGRGEPTGKRLLDRSAVMLENHFRPQTEADTRGVGYPAWADAARVEAEDVAKYAPIYGPLIVVRVERLGAAKGHPEHIAVNASSVSLSYRVAP
ncbi:MAG: hypothetical protein PHW86_07240 [Candidatus Bipolaricaulis sp.]|nr:hypothetical protein [Candidatus Bipolaricaulis sp.]